MFFLPYFCIGRLGKERIVPHSVVGPPALFVFFLIFVCARHGYTHWRAVLATAWWTLEGYRTPDEALVC